MPAEPSSRPVKRRRGARVVVLTRSPGEAAADDERDVPDAAPQISVLLQGDRDPGVPGSGFWQTPGGGIDEGESPREAAVRELYEETGLVLTPAELGEPVATRTVTHGYSDRILIQHETYYRVLVDRFDPVHTALSEAEARRRVETAWFGLDALPLDVWPAELAALAMHDGLPLDLGAVEESTVPTRGQRLLDE